MTNIQKIMDCFYCTARNTNCERYKPRDGKKDGVCRLYIELQDDIERVYVGCEPLEFEGLEDWLMKGGVR